MGLFRKVRRRSRADHIIIYSLIFLVIFGLAMLASASSHIGKLRFNDSYYYLKHQLLYGLTLGIIGFFLGSKIYYRVYEKIAVIFLLINIILLLLVFTPLGITAGGAERWVKIGPVSFQPGEFLKLSLVIYLAAWLGRQRSRSSSFIKGFLPLLIVLTVVIAILLKQPSTTTALLLMVTALIIYFVSGARLSFIIGAFLIGAIALGSIIYFSPYRWERIQTFLNPETNIQTTGYHINQALIAIGSGGLLGRGYGQSTAKVRYLPEPIGDSIFVVIAEELGFVGAFVLIGVFVLLVTRIFLLTKKAPDRFGQLLLTGFALIIGLQVFINIAAVSGAIPLTGAPLPFISFGGTALAVFLTMAGIINNIAKHS